MFKLVTLEDTIRIPPEKFGQPIESVGYEQLRMKYEGIVDEELGYVIAVIDIKVNPVGKIIPGDGATFHKVTFSLLTFYPIIHEIVEGEVVEIAEFGAKETKRTLTTGDPVRVRITAVSLGRGGSGKIGVTARQPFLGKFEWIEQEIAQISGKEAEQTKPEQAESEEKGE